MPRRPFPPAEDAQAAGAALAIPQGPASLPELAGARGSPAPGATPAASDRRWSHAFQRGGGLSSLAQAVRDHVEGLEVTQGEGAGSGLSLFPWEWRFLRGALRRGRRSAALSIARGNGKSTVVAAIATAALDGPLAVRRGEVVIVASSFGQARISFEHVLGFMGDRLRDRSTWRVLDNSNTALIEHRRTGARVRAIASDPRRAHGLAPALVLADEPAQWPPAMRDRMLAALQTGLGKVPDSRFWSLGTRPDGEHWFDRQLSGGADYVQLHAAASKLPIGHRRTWLRANPSLDFMPSLEAAIRDEAGKAKADPTLLPSFEALRLNRGTPDTLQTLLLSAATWARIEGLALPSGPYVLGVDLGSSAAMSAAAGYWPASGALTALACFPEVPDLRERGMRDGVADRYLRMERAGDLILAGRRVSDVPTLLRTALERWGPPAAVVADRWREAELREALEAIGFPVGAALVTRGQGFKDGGADVRRFRGACLGGLVTPSKSLLLRSAMSEARTVSDPAGNVKLAKRVEGGRRNLARDDAAAAAILAVAEGDRRRGQAHIKRRFAVA